MGSSLSERVSLVLSKADRKLRVARKLYDDGEYEDAKAFVDEIKKILSNQVVP